MWLFIGGFFVGGMVGLFLMGIVSGGTAETLEKVEEILLDNENTNIGNKVTIQRLKEVMFHGER